MGRHSPTSVVYILTHALVFVIGMVCVLLPNAIPNSPTWVSVLLISIGTSLIAAGVTGWVVYVYVRSSERISAALDSFMRFGFVGAYSNRSIKIREEYDERMKRFQKGADVMGFGLSSLRQDHIKSFPIWKQQGPIRILLIDPEYPSPEFSFANQRDLEEQDQPGTIARQVRHFIKDTAHICEPGRFEIRLYRCLPMLNMFRIDDDILWGPYLVRELSRNTPTFLVRAGGEMYIRLMTHFERIWTDETLSRAIPADWLQEANSTPST